MIESATTQLRKTALNAVHRRMGAKMVNFGGWDMPVEYSGILAEHMAMRTAAGLFDVSHMGEIEVRGPHALDLVQYVTCNDAAKLADGQAQYSGLMTSGGHVRGRPARAQNLRRALFALRQRQQSGRATSTTSRATIAFGAELENAGPRYSQLAIQGPRSAEILERFTDVRVARPERITISRSAR